MKWLKIVLVMQAVALAGCPGRSAEDGDAGTDARSDVSREAAADSNVADAGSDVAASEDATPDVAREDATAADAQNDAAAADVAHEDAGEDAAPDVAHEDVAADTHDAAVATDAGEDTAPDVAHEDAGEDVAMDAAVEDAGTDAGVDPGMDVVIVPDVAVEMDAAIAVDAAQEEDAAVDVAPVDVVILPVVAPVPVSPTSAGILSSLSATFRWRLEAGTEGARLEVCRDRACTSVVETRDVVGTSTTVTLADPAAGASRVYFWRVYGLTGATASALPSNVWSFSVRGRSATAASTSWGSQLDVNGDGLTDVAVGAAPANLVRVYTGQAATPPVLSAATTAITGPAGSSFGASIAGAGDVNGDGYADLIVGAPGADAAYVFYGSATGLPAALSHDLANATITGDALSRFGASVAGAGDVDRDGYADVIIGAPDGAAAYVFRGGPTGFAASLTTAAAAVTLTGPTGSRYGFSVAGAGDANADGYADVIVGAPGANAAYVYNGSDAGLPAAASVVLSGDAASDFGYAVATADDVNGDGYADVIVGAPLINIATVYHGSDAGVSATVAGRLRKTSTGPLMFGTSVASAGDGNGDGYADLIVGAPGVVGMGSLSIAYVFHGSATGVPITATTSTTTHQRSFSNANTASRLGASVASAGDLNGDGYTDVLVGAPGTLNAVYVYAGSATGFPAATTATLTGGTGVTGFGTSVW